jgi:hypothetical protein
MMPSSALSLTALCQGNARSMYVSFPEPVSRTFLASADQIRPPARAPARTRWHRSPTVSAAGRWRGPGERPGPPTAGRATSDMILCSYRILNAVTTQDHDQLARSRSGTVAMRRKSPHCLDYQMTGAKRPAPGVIVTLFAARLYLNPTQITGELQALLVRFGALPSSALPSSTLPSGAPPSSTLPSGVPPSRALPSSTLPSRTPPSGAPRRTAPRREGGARQRARCPCGQEH